MTLTLTGAGLTSPLYLFCAAYEGGLIVCEGYLTDSPIPKGARLTDGAHSISVPLALEPGLFLQHEDNVGNRLSEPTFLLRETHDD